MQVNKLNNKWLKGMVVILLMGSIVSAGYLYYKPTSNVADAVAVQEYSLKKRSVEELLTTSGVVKAKEVEQLLGDVSSEVTAIHVAIGDEVSKGDVLAEMNPIDVNSAILDQEVVIENLKKEINSLSADKGGSVKLSYEHAKTAYKNSKASYESNQILFTSGAISQLELDQSLENYNNALSQYESQKLAYDSYDYTIEYSILEKKLEVEKIKLESYQQSLEDHQIIASIDGVITAINIEEGEIPKESDVMMEVQNLSELKVEASISEYEINAVAIGQEVEISSLGNDDVLYRGLVETIYPSGVVEDSEVFVTVIIDVLDEDAQLKPNFSTNLEICIERKDDAFLVPYDALIKTPKGYAIRVKTADSETGKLLAVETGIESDLMIEIMEASLTEDTLLLVSSTIETQGQEVKKSLIPGVTGMPKGDMKRNN